MKGYTTPTHGYLDPELDEEELGELELWEAMVVNAVGTVIEFWGFKRNQGKVWALLYLRHAPMTAADIRNQLGLSKGAVSMILREVETWGVIRRVRRPGSQAWHFVAEVELLKMIGRVFQDREVSLVRRVKEDLVEAERIAKEAGDVPELMLDRLTRMRRLAGLIEHALDVFLKTAQLDVTDIEGIFTDEEFDEGSPDE
ncbi:MAG: MarR family transcriptional regulator [Myxococcota bacterium]|jgi:DNA-binding transcriptional regulator GbsR (MarR family)|nr:MarR family transcriptional regulator [Myxococcota bacterium]MEC9440546.1 MarR family transcriptional regulator [Myxococcota bacterium]